VRQRIVPTKEEKGFAQVLTNICHTRTAPPRSIPVRAAALGNQAALIGAAAPARDEARFR
jgi:hypothetical protein